MMDEILGRTTETKSAKQHAYAVIKNKDLYTKEDVKEAIDMVYKDGRISVNEQMKICDKLRMIYRRKKREEIK